MLRDGGSNQHRPDCDVQVCSVISPARVNPRWFLSELQYNSYSQIRHVCNAIGRLHCVLGGHRDALYPAVPLRGVFRAEQGEIVKYVTCGPDEMALAPKQARALFANCIAYDGLVSLQEGAKEYFASFFNFLDFTKIFFLTAIVIIRFMFLSVYSSIDFAPLDPATVKARTNLSGRCR